MPVRVFYKRVQTKIQTKEDLIVELENLKGAYLRIKVKFLFEIYEMQTTGLIQVKDFKRFAIDALIKKTDFILIRETDFISDGTSFGKKLLYSTFPLRRMIPIHFDKRGITIKFCDS